MHSRPLRQECHDLSLVSAISCHRPYPFILIEMCKRNLFFKKSTVISQHLHLVGEMQGRHRGWARGRRECGRRECGRREATLRASSSSLRSRSEIIFVSFTDSIFRNLASRCACIPCMSPQAHSMYVTIDHNSFIYVTIYHMPFERVLPHVAEDTSRTAHIPQRMYHTPSGTPFSTRHVAHGSSIYTASSPYRSSL